MNPVHKTTHACGIRFPWISTFGALMLTTYLYVSTQPELIAFYHIPDNIFQHNIQLIVISLFFFSLVFDARTFYTRVRSYELSMDKLNNQINELLIAKKRLQNKAHTFSGHADKLKLFISDRLLEYIEYDEKFLHFKSIAAEVRHTGVICFDKVQTTLKHAIDQAFEQDRETYQEALDSMIYLWDLLELSTTDNLALHISNKLCECEEHYYQSLLNDNVLSDELSPPTFEAWSALIKALNPLLDKPLEKFLLNNDSDPVIINSDATFWVRFEQTKHLLGNENHIVLLLENLINNAVFYSSKKAYTHKHARIAIQSLNHSGNIRFSIYNHGPHINDDKEQIFQLGYSTRKVRDNNGKGLGLYFVNEIVKGYEGSITFENIYNRENIYSIRIALANQTVITEVIETRLSQGKIACKRASDERLCSVIEWCSDEAVTGIEVSTQAAQQTFSFSTNNAQHHCFTDPEDASRPHWAVEVTQRKRSNKITFTPLDISGVCFFVDLPSADSRLDYSDCVDENLDTGEQDLVLLRKHFVDPDTYTG